MPPDDRAPEAATPKPAPAPTAMAAPTGPKALPPTEREIARRAAEELLKAAGIRQVIWVDDQAIAAAPETAVGLVELIWSKKPSAVQRVLTKPVSDDPEVRALQVREHVTGLSGVDVPLFLGKLRAERQKLRSAGALPGPDRDEDAEDAHQLFSSEIEPLIGGRLRVMLPDDWDNQGPAIVEAAFGAAGSGSIPGLPDTLILFDIDLREAGRGIDAGKDLAIALVKKFSPRPILCGIISSTVPSRDEREGWTSGVALGPDSLVFIAKRDLGSAPLEFVAELKRVLLSPFAATFREISIGLLDGAHVFASARVKDVSVSDLVYSVIGLSHDEGVTEIDTLRRIYDSYFREELRRLAAIATDLESTVTQLRAISKLAPVAKRATQYTTWKHQRREMYDNLGEVNRLHLPVEVGDVFEFTPPTHQNGAGGPAAPVDLRAFYVLVAQPCHAIVRGDGRRKLMHGTLAQLLATRPVGSNGHTYELPWFGENGATAFVDFTSTITVPFDVLDLCVLRDDGVAALSMNDGEPSGIMAGWKMRREEVRKAAEAYVDFVRASFKLLAGDAAELKLPTDPSAASPLSATVTMLGTKAVSYNCKRVHRILMPYAAAILGEYANYVSHDVFDVDLGRGLKPYR